MRHKNENSKNRNPPQGGVLKWVELQLKSIPKLSHQTAPPVSDISEACPGTFSFSLAHSEVPPSPCSLVYQKSKIIRYFTSLSVIFTPQIKLIH